MKKENEEQFIKTRLVKADAPYLEVITKISNAAKGDFSIKTYNDRGLSNVVNMMHLDLLGEACGVEGGGVYLFNNGKNLIKAFEYSQISDAGVYWYNENYLFPDDENGVAGKLVYKEEIGSYQDEETNWTEIKTTQREFEWKNNRLEPNVLTEE